MSDEAQRVSQLPDGSFLVDPPPKRPTPWGTRVIVGLLGLALVLLIVSVAGTTYRTFVPRPPTPYYVCVYITVQGTTTVSGPEPCTAP